MSLCVYTKPLLNNQIPSYYHNLQFNFNFRQQQEEILIKTHITQIFLQFLTMDDDVVHRVLQEGGRDYYQQTPSTSSSSPSILQSLPLHAVC